MKAHLLPANANYDDVKRIQMAVSDQVGGSERTGAQHLLNAEDMEIAAHREGVYAVDLHNVKPDCAVELSDFTYEISWYV